jgi:hypothetical protein
MAFPQLWEGKERANSALRSLLMVDNGKARKAVIRAW